MKELKMEIAKGWYKRAWEGLISISDIILSIWFWFTILLLVGLTISHRIKSEWVMCNIYPIYKKVSIVNFIVLIFKAIVERIRRIKYFLLRRKRKK